jgi:phage-related protein
MQSMERRLSWIKAAKRDFEDFPEAVRMQMLRALEIAVAGQMADIAKPMKGLGTGVFEIRVSYRTDAYRTIYAVKIGDDVYVVHAFQKRSITGIKTPQKDIDLIKGRLKQLKELLR